MFSNYLLNNSKTEKISFDNNSNEKCFSNLSKEISLKENCLNFQNEIFIKKSSKINLFISNKNPSNIFDKFLLKFNSELTKKECFPIDLIIVSEYNQSILFQSKDELNLIIDINEISSKRFSYKIFVELDRKSTRLNSSHERLSRMPSSA